MNLSVVIPSKTLSNLIPCMEAVRLHEPQARIIVVDDGLENRNFLKRSELSPICVVNGEKPFSFPRNCNRGMRMISDDDSILLNDDALLMSPDGFSLMQQAAEQNHSIGIVSSATNVTGNPEQYRRAEAGLRLAERNIAFVCVLIPRRTIEAVGWMDERFGGVMPDGRTIYGSCDSDYCRRARNAGLKIAIHDGCYVDHGSLRSSFRGDPRAAGDCSAGRELYQQKWGDLN